MILSRHHRRGVALRAACAPATRRAREPSTLRVAPPQRWDTDESAHGVPSARHAACALRRGRATTPRRLGVAKGTVMPFHALELALAALDQLATVEAKL